MAPALGAGAVVAMALLLANIPGSPVVGPYILSDGKYGPHFECGFESMVHGWPFPFLRHNGDYTKSFDRPSPWRVGDNVRFTPWALAANSGLLFAGVIAVGWIVRRRIEKVGWRFGVIHVLLSIVCVAVVMAYMGSRYRIHEAQIAYLQRNGRSIDFAEWAPMGPYWLRELTGPRYWEWGDRLVAMHVEYSDEIAELPGESAIKVLGISTIQGDAIPSLKDFDNLVAIDMCLVNRDPEFWPCLRVISQCKSLQALNLYDTGVTERDLRELVGMPELVNLELSRNPEITDEGLVHLASMKGLQKLGLWGTGVTKKGIEKLQASLPDCEIGWDEM
jgi:hypothetical protein